MVKALDSLPEGPGFEPDSPQHTLRAFRNEVVQEQLQDDMCETDIADQARWIECKYRTSHPVIRWLPTKLASWIVGVEIIMVRSVGMPRMCGQQWTAVELNTILFHNLVPSSGSSVRLYLLY